MEWTKTNTGYACGVYAVNRTPGRRWVVTRNGEPVADGKQFAKLSDAKNAADADTSARAVARLNEPLVDAVLGVGQRDPRGWKFGDYDATDAPPVPPEPAKPDPDLDPDKIVLPPGAEPLTPADDEPDEPCEPTPLESEDFPPGTSQNPEPAGYVRELDETPRDPFVLPVPVSRLYRPEPRESLTDQFTRLAIYRDVGIVRRYLRNSA